MKFLNHPLIDILLKRKSVKSANKQQRYCEVAWYLLIPPADICIDQCGCWSEVHHRLTDFTVQFRYRFSFMSHHRQKPSGTLRNPQEPAEPVYQDITSRLWCGGETGSHVFIFCWTSSQFPVGQFHCNNKEEGRRSVDGFHQELPAGTLRSDHRRGGARKRTDTSCAADRSSEIISCRNPHTPTHPDSTQPAGNEEKEGELWWFYWRRKVDLLSENSSSLWHY